MQLRNNYEKNVFNGDVGKIIALVKNDQKITVDYEGHLVGYEGDELDELSLAYACTIHKSQGSEYPAVILVLDSSHFRMLQRNLLYTGITRAKGHVWILSGNGAFDEAIRNNRMQLRYTRLKEFIGSKIKDEPVEQALPPEKNPYDKFMQFLNES
jgi:exodeoxyribonuclease V alpha subunit